MATSSGTAEKAREYGGPILELGAGTGRIMFPLAQEGLSVHALGPNPQGAVVPGAKRPHPDEPPPLTRSQVRELKRRVRDLEDRTRYVLDNMRVTG